MKGFSLIELLVAITIGGVLLSIAWVRMSTLVPIYQLEGAARAVAAEIQKVRGRAIAENKCFMVSFDTSAKTYLVQSKTGAPTCGTASYTTDSSEPSAQKIDPNGGIQIDNGSGGAPTNAVLNPRGNPESVSNAYPVIRLTNSAGATRTVFVQSTGRVNVQ